LLTKKMAVVQKSFLAWRFESRPHGVALTHVDARQL